MREPRPRRLLLIGFMGSGKTTVGRLLAGRLGWRFVDFDDVVEAESGRSIPAIFAESGEQEFRRLEEGVARRLLAEDGVVLGAGGGWAVAPARVGAVPAGTATVWLRVSAEEALRRVGADGGRTRPLLEAEDPLGRARMLLVQREPYYAVAGWVVDTEGRLPVDVCDEIQALMNPSGGQEPSPERR